MSKFIPLTIRQATLDDGTIVAPKDIIINTDSITYIEKHKEHTHLFLQGLEDYLHIAEPVEEVMARIRA